MSVFRDDISLSNALEKIQSSLFQTKPIKESPAPEEIPSKEQKDFEEVTLSENTQKRHKYDTETIENFQKEVNLLQVTEQGLSAIANELKEAKSQVEKVIEEPMDEKELEKTNSSIQDHLKKVKEISENTSFNDIKPLNGSSSDNTRTNEEKESIINVSSGFREIAATTENSSVKTRQEAEEFLRKLNMAVENVQNRQEEVVKFEEKVLQKVDSLIEFESNLNSKNADEEFSEMGNKLKEAVINGIIEDPQTGKKIQIRTLDENIILALLSVTKI